MTTGFFNGNFDLFQFIQRQQPTFFAGASCKGMDANLFHPGQGKAQDLKKALAICEGCAVRRDCLIYAVDNNERVGVWGGTSSRQRLRWMEGGVSGEQAWKEIIGDAPPTPLRASDIRRSQRRAELRKKRKALETE
jgi:hypothetical protein